jgi:tRNA(Ile2) C34 agmatinyltransferase TiaS
MHLTTEKSRKANERRKQAYNMAQIGIATKEISAAMGVTDATVRGMINKENLRRERVKKLETKTEEKSLLCPHCGKQIKVVVTVDA